jgi:uncharacterized protein (DUF111 family)
MKYVHFDASSGASGDMILGALLDLGVDAALFKEKMAGLRLPVEIAVRRVRRGGFGAVKVDVGVKGHEHIERTFADVERVIRRARFSPSVKDRALAIFERLFEAEAKVHGRRFKEAHLHEAGADDALVDVVGAAFLLDELGIGEVYCSPLNVGSGWVRTSHGVLSVPPPAVAELLKNAPPAGKISILKVLPSVGGTKPLRAAQPDPAGNASLPGRARLPGGRNPRAPAHLRRRRGRTFPNRLPRP